MPRQAKPVKKTVKKVQTPANNGRKLQTTLTVIKEQPRTWTGMDDGFVLNAAQLPLPLIELAERGDGEAIFRMVDKKGIDLRSNPPRTASGDTPLHVAASGGHLNAVMALLIMRADVDVLGYRLRTPLHCAAAKNRLAVCEYLLDYGATLDKHDADGATALTMATRKGCTEVVSLLLDRGAKYDKYVVAGCQRESLLMQAAKAKRWKIVDQLLDEGESATMCKNDKECALVLASRDGQPDAVRHLLRCGAASNTEQVKLALMEAKSAAVVWAFLEFVSDQVLGEAGGCGMREAARNGRLEPMSVFLNAGVQIDNRDPDNGCTSLHYASGKGHLECVQELVRRHADINAKDKDGYTPLHWATARGHVECVKELVRHRADVKIKNDKGKTPLDMAKTEEVRAAFKVQRCY